MPSPRSSLLVVLLVLLALPARAGVDVQLPGKASVLGTLDGAGQVDRLRLEGLEGMALTLKIVAQGLPKGATGPDFSLTISGPGGAVDFAAVEKAKDFPRSIKIVGLVLPATGEYTLDLGADGLTDYRLSLKAKLPTLADQVVVVGASGGGALLGGPTLALVPTLSGSRVTVSAAYKGKGDVVPRLEAFSGAGVLGKEKLKPKAHTQVFEGVAGGEQTIEVTNAGSEAGEIVVKVKLKAPKIKPAKLDLRASVLGVAPGETTLVGALIDGALGGQVEVTDGDSSLHGAAVSLPAGAFAGLRLITIATAVDAAVAEEGQAAAGPTVALGPDGLAFDVTAGDALVTIPYEPGRLPLGAVPADLTVQQDRKKQVLSLDAESVDAEDATVTVVVDGFSTFSSRVPAGSPNLDGRSYWFVGQDVEMVPGVPSDERRVAHVFGAVTFSGEAGGTYAFEGDELETSFGHAGSAGFVDTSDQPLEEGGLGGTWAYDPGLQSLTVDEGGDPASYFVAADGSVLVGADSLDEDSPDTSFELFVERAAEAPTPAALAGEYWVFDYRLEVHETGGGPLELEGANSVGMLTLGADGSLSITQFKERLSGFYGGADFEAEVGTFALEGSYTVQGDGSLLIDFGEGETERFFPSKDRGVILGSQQVTPAVGSDEGLFSLAVLVRKASDLGLGALRGDAVYSQRELGYELAGTEAVPDLKNKLVEARLSLDGTKALFGNTVAWTDRNVSRNDGNQVDGLLIEGSSWPGGVPNKQDAVDFPASFSLKKDGRLGIGGILEGAIAPSAVFGFGVFGPKLKEFNHAAVALLVLPPEAP